MLITNDNPAMVHVAIRDSLTQRQGWQITDSPNTLPEILQDNLHEA